MFIYMEFIFFFLCFDGMNNIWFDIEIIICCKELEIIVIKNLSLVFKEYDGVYFNLLIFEFFGGFCKFRFN